jgi:hypothetical protein
VTTKAPTAEICNGKDDDCNGVADDGLGKTTCGMGECQRTVDNCVSGTPVTCVPGTPVAEFCDGKDNDCNGTPDDLPALSCGVGACANTAPACVSGAPGACTPKPKGTESCNGIDDDCNGSVDDGLAPLTCGLGICFNTVAACVSGVPQTCTPKPSSPEACDGLDNDCDGVTDNGAASTLCPPPSHTDTTVCSSGTCKTSNCTTGFVDVDGIFSNGCECADSLTPHSCAAAKDLGTLSVGSSKLASSVAPVPGRDDWYKLTLLNVKDNNLAHPKLEFITNPGSAFVLEVVPDACGSTSPSCSEGGTATAMTTWESYYISSAGSCGQANYSPIPTLLPSSAKRSCTPVTDVNVTIYFRVYYRTGAAATCAGYTIQAQN